MSFFISCQRSSFELKFNLIGKVTAGEKGAVNDRQANMFRFQKAKFKLVKLTETDFEATLETKVIKAAGKN